MHPLNEIPFSAHILGSILRPPLHHAPGESKILVFLDGRNRAIVIAESLERVIAAIRVASVRWQSYLPPKHRNQSSQALRLLCCDLNRAIGVHLFNMRSTWNCGMVRES